MTSRLSSMPAWARWMIYAASGVLLLTIVQSISDTDRLTQISTSREMLRWAVPIFLAGLGGLFSERAGVVNIGLEGMLILGMWFGAWGSIEYGAWWGLLIGIVGGMIGGLLHAVATVTFQVDHIISGVAINILAPAITRYLSEEVWDSPTTSPQTAEVGTWDVPFLAGGTIFGWESPDWLLTASKWEIWYLSDVAQLSRGLLRSTSW
ncbi:MAG: ABC transporter permease, partial [Acidimicrobiales bacterium]|nr:ABC transporter permease [Acidimicrobiales bacterium]